MYLAICRVVHKGRKLSNTLREEAFGVLTYEARHVMKQKRVG